MATRLTAERVVIAEGRDDEQLVEAVARRLDLAGLQILRFDGVDNLRGYLKALPAVSGFTGVRSLGIVCDAEGNAQGRFQNVRGSLMAAGLPAPAAPLIPKEGPPRIVVLVNPHEAPAGSLDDVCIQSVHDHPAMPCVDAYVQCLAEAGVPAPHNRAKTRTHAFIASRDRPDVSLGIAFQRGYFPLGHAAFEPVRRLLLAL